MHIEAGEISEGRSRGVGRAHELSSSRARYKHVCERRHEDGEAHGDGDERGNGGEPAARHLVALGEAASHDAWGTWVGEAGGRFESSQLEAP